MTQGGEWAAARRLLARTLYKEMKEEGLGPDQIMEFTTELLGLVGDEINDRGPNSN
jgi:hypothetical protein